MLNTKNIELITSKHKPVILKKDESAFLFNKHVNEAEKKLDILLDKIKSLGGSQSLRRENVGSLHVVGAIQTNQFGKLLNLFLIDRNKITDKDFETLKKKFNELNTLFDDITAFYRKNRPFTTFDYPYPLFKFVVDFFGRHKVGIHQIVAIKEKDLPKNKTGDMTFNRYLNSQYGHNYGSNFFIQSVSFTVK